MQAWKQRFTVKAKTTRHFLWKTENVVITEEQMKIALKNPAILQEHFEEVTPITKEEAEARDKEALDEVQPPLIPAAPEDGTAAVERPVPLTADDEEPSV